MDLQTRVKTTIFRPTRVTKRRLRHGVVLGVEVEDDLVPGLGRLGQQVGVNVI